MGWITPFDMLRDRGVEYVVRLYSFMELQLGIHHPGQRAYRPVLLYEIQKKYAKWRQNGSLSILR